MKKIPILLGIIALILLISGVAPVVAVNERATLSITTYNDDTLIANYNAECARGLAEDWQYPPYAGAWIQYKWNGRVLPGSGDMEHLKIIWVGYDLQSSSLWRDGGEPYGDQFEIIMRLQDIDKVHELLKTVPNGLGLID